MVREQGRALCWTALFLLLVVVLRVTLSSTILRSRGAMFRSCASLMVFMCRTWRVVVVRGSTMSQYTNPNCLRLAILFLWAMFAWSIFSSGLNKLPHYHFLSRRLH